jgi:Predicted transcriptional regulators
MRIGDIAHRAGVSVKTIRYYERVGILAPASREPNGYRSYEPGVLDRLAFTRSAQAVGLNLGEIREIIAFRERGEPPCAHVLDLIVHRASELTERIAQLEMLRADLEALTERGRQLDPADCSPTSICHIIEPGTVALSQRATL